MSHQTTCCVLAALLAVTPLPGDNVQAAPPNAGEAVAPKLTDEMLGRVIRERAVWENNRLGITDEIPPPWTPMTVNGKRVACWGRSYDYAESLFPKSVESQGEEILAGPIVLAATVEGKEVLIQKADTQTLTAAPNRVDLDAAATAAGLSVHVKSHVEYDGCVKVELTLSALQKPVLLEGLELRIPVATRRALYYHLMGLYRALKCTNAGALPPGGLKSEFKPQLWLGDDDRGFCWFCESPKGWELTDKDSAIQVEPGQETCTMRIRMVDRPFTIGRTWSVVFGLMATPMRAMPQGWRDWLIPLNQTNPFASWQPGFNNIGGTPDAATLTPRDPAAMKSWVRQTQEKGWPVPYLRMREPTKVMPYSQILFWAGKHYDGMPSPEIKVFGPEWSYERQAPGPRRESDDQIPLKEYYMVCPASSFSQYYMYKLNELIDQTGIDGIYLDGVYFRCSNPLHGCGYADDKGQWQMEYKIWAHRELLKRIYCLFHEKRKNPIIHVHTSSWLCAPCISFSHMVLDGEQYNDVGQQLEEHVLDRVPLDKWRAEHTGRQWGPAPFLLPVIAAPWTNLESPTRELLLLTNLHDTGIFPAGQNTRLVMRNYQARRLFGVADCAFRGYWGNADWVKCETPECYVSVYRKPDGSRALLVVGNTAKTAASVVVRPNLAGLKLEGGEPNAGVDLETGETMAIAGGAMTLPVKGRDFRLIALPFYNPPPITAGDFLATALKQIPNPGFENGLEGWGTAAQEGNTGSVTLDKETKFAGTASCHLHKAVGPGGVMLHTADVLLVEPGRTYRANCRLRIADANGAKAYWMISSLNAQGESIGTNCLFSGYVAENQDWKQQPFDFQPPAGTAAIRLHFLVAFPGSVDAWVDDLALEPVK